MSLKKILPFIIIISLIFFSFIGCTKKESPPPLTDPDEKFLKILKDEFGYEAILKAVDQTLWVYLPRKRELFIYKVQEQQNISPRKFSIEFLDSSFKDNMFALQYDIIPITKSPESGGLTSAYSDEANEEYRNLFTAITRTYLDLKEPPQFIVLVIADIVNGLEIIYTYCTEDIKKYQIGALPYQEFAFRSLSETRGNKNIINDTLGKHIEYKDIQWSGFLAEQIKSRINFKYQSSDFQPTSDHQKEILKVVAQITKKYDFTDFSYVRLRDLRKGTTRLYNKSELAGFRESSPSGQ